MIINFVGIRLAILVNVLVTLVINFVLLVVKKTPGIQTLLTTRSTKLIHEEH